MKEPGYYYVEYQQDRTERDAIISVVGEKGFIEVVGSNGYLGQTHLDTELGKQFLSGEWTELFIDAVHWSALKSALKVAKHTQKMFDGLYAQLTADETEEDES